MKNVKLDLSLHDFNVAVGALNFVAQNMSTTSQELQRQANAQLSPPAIGGSAGPADQPEPGTAPSAPTNVVAVEFGGPTDAERA